MRVLFDVLGAPARSGGMRQYAELLIGAWLDDHPDDEVAVLGDRWVAESFAGRQIRHLRWPGERFAGRALGQFVVAGVAHRARRADITISVSTIVSPLVPRSRRICVIHDWRHVLRSAEFGVGQRLYRTLWKHSARTAGALVSISSKTLRESRRIVPAARHALVPSGHDHARLWALGDVTAAESVIVTFGHHANKRPELVIEAFARLTDPDRHRLIVLGARDERADALRTVALSNGVAAAVELPGFVPEEEYRRLIAGASAVVLASTDEGFGLPGSEAAYFGVPFVVTTDGGLGELHPAAFVADPEAGALAAALADALARGRGARGRTPSTWRETAAGFRALALASIRDPRPARPRPATAEVRG